MFNKLKILFENKQNLILNIALILIIAIASYMAFSNLGGNPVSLNQDEAINGYDAYSIGLTGKDHHGATQPQPMLQSFNDWTSPLITFITIPFVKIFGLEIWSIRLPVALLGVLSIVFFYLLTIQIFKSKKVAVLGAAIWAFSPWLISISRWAIPPSIVPFFLLLFLVLLVYSLNSKENNFKTWFLYILTGIAAGALTYAYPTMKLFVPVFLGAIALLILMLNREKFKNIFVSGFTCLLIISPIFYLTLLEPEKYNARYAYASIGATGENLFTGVLLRYSEYFTPIFAFGFGDPNNMHKVQSFSSIASFLSLFFYIGLIYIAYKICTKKIQFIKDNINLSIIVLGLLIFPVAAALTKDHFMLLRTIHGFVFITIFILIGLRLIYAKLKSSKLQIALFISIGLLLTFNVVSFFIFYMNYYPDSAKAGFNYGVKEAFEYVDTNDEKYSKVYIDRGIHSIYYLFSTKYDPEKLHVNNSDDKLRIFKEGTIIFEDIEKSDMTNPKLLFLVEDHNKIWYSIYESEDKMYVFKELQYKDAKYQF